jgi:hypothetical protein
MLKYVIVLLVIAAIAPLSGAHSAQYYMSPSGNDGHDGSLAHPWATLQKARTVITAGDILYIMGGTYTNAQYFHDETGAIRGTAERPVTFKAYGDGVAVFTSTGPNPLGRWYRGYFLFTSGASDYIVIDGYSSLSNEPYFLRFEGHEETHNLIRFGGSASNYIEHITVKGIELDGSHTSGFSGGRDDVAVGLYLEYCRMSTVDNNYIHHIHHPTGPIPPGDNTERVQGSGHGIYVYSCELLLIQNNTIKYCNHGAMELEIQRPSGHAARYNRVINNFIEQRYGGGIYMPFNAHHNLIEGNIITRCGETTDFGKPGIQLSGSSNTIRKNVIYNPVNQPLRLEAQTAIGYHYIADDNLVYNNVIFSSRYSLGILVKNISDPNCSAERNKFYNNIFYRSIGTVEDSGGRQAEITIDLYGANEAHNWCDPDASGCLPGGTLWGGNRFGHNCVRRNSDGASYSRLVIWARDATYGGGWVEWSLSSLQSGNPVVWHNNIGLDPLLASEEPDSYGLSGGWWYLRSTSPCIDAGVVVNDEIGAYVQSLYPGYGWGNLSYSGSAPDIGAYEFNGENPAPPSAPHIRISPANR